MTACSRERAKRTVDFLIRYSIHHVLLCNTVLEDPNYLNFLRLGTLVFGLVTEMATSYIIKHLSVRSAELLEHHYPLNVPMIHVHAATTVAIAAGFAAFLDQYDVACFRWIRNVPPSLRAFADRIQHGDLLVDPVMARLEVDDEVIRRLGVTRDLLERINEPNLPHLQMALRSFLPACDDLSTVYYWDPSSLHQPRDRVTIHWPIFLHRSLARVKRPLERTDSDDDGDDEPKQDTSDSSSSSLSSPPQA